MTGIGDTFQRETSYIRGQLPAGVPSQRERPEAFKTYPDAPRVSLDPPQTTGGAGLWDLLRARRSVRAYHSDGLVSAAAVSQLLWATAGVTRVAGDVALRTAPSAGALYPIETYVAIHDVDGLGAGLYHYDVREHALEQLATGDQRQAVSAVALDQGMAADASLVLLWTAVFNRSKQRYLERGQRYIYLDAGHMAQNAALAAVALDLGTCQIAALFDGEGNALLGLDGVTESLIYMASVGPPRAATESA